MMPTVCSVPSEYSSIRDAIVAHALGEGPESAETEELENFRNWLIYESPAAGADDFECVIRLDDLEFEDDEVRFDQDLPEDSPITNEQRLDYARRFIDSYDEEGHRDPYFAQGIELQTVDGRTAFYCCLTQMGGQSGLLPEWYGCHADLDAFLRYLKGKGWWALKDPATGIPDEKLLDLWYHGPAPRG
jgi:hypothetical protein